MRTLALCAAMLIVTAPAVRAACPADSTVDVKFMTYNVRAPGWNQARRTQVVGAINDERPDVLGLHEARLSGSGGDLLADLQAEYEPHHTDTGDPIYLRRERGFQVVEEGVATLSACQVGGPIDLTWVRVLAPGGARFTFYNVHFCVSAPQLGGDPEGNQTQAIEAATFMQANAEDGAIDLLAGDVNANQTSPTIMYLRDGTPLTIGGGTFFNPIDLDDSWELSEANAGMVKPGTGALSASGAVLDWLLVDPVADVTAAEVIEFVIPPGEEDGFSDHFPVTAALAFDAQQTTIPTVCGDLDLDLVLDDFDINLLRTALADPAGSALSAAAEGRCPVILPVSSGCDLLDLVVMRRQFEGCGLPPLIDPVCPAAP